METSLREQELLRRAARGVPVYPVRSVSATDNVLESDAFLLVDTTSGSVTLTLPAAAYMRGRLVCVKKLVAANTVTVDGSGSETIDGSATLAWTTAYQTYTLLCDGSTWHIV